MYIRTQRAVAGMSEEFLDNWCDSCGVGTTYTDDVKYKIRIPWDKYERDYKE